MERVYLVWCKITWYWPWKLVVKVKVEQYKHCISNSACFTLGDSVVSSSRMEFPKHPEFTWRVDSYLMQQEFNHFHISVQVVCLQGQTLLKTFSWFLCPYNLCSVQYSLFSFQYIYVMLFQIGGSLSWDKMASVASCSRFSSGAVLGKHILPSSSVPHRTPHNVFHCFSITTTYRFR